MPQIYDNIKLGLIDGLRKLMSDAIACSFCVGYLNLRGLEQVRDLIQGLQGGDEAHACRLLIGKFITPEEEMKFILGMKRQIYNDGPTRARLRDQILKSLKEQLEFGIPSPEAEASLRWLADQLKKRKVIIKAFLRYPLHAKLYIVQRNDPVTSLICFVGSSNLTLAGLSRQGELNLDVVEQDAARKLQDWFDQRWYDELSIALNEDIVRLIESSWARKDLVSPYLIFLKMAYHLSEEARIGERQFKLPKGFESVLLDFQSAAVQLASRLLYKRGGVLLGDVVGLGKTLMATAVAKIFQEDDGSNTLIICPPEIQPLWQFHIDKYGLTGRVISLGKVIEELPNLPRFRTLIIDESHNLRNRASKRYQAIHEYIQLNEPRVILVTATPYNKDLSDISNQLRLFVDEDEDLGIRPERFLEEYRKQGHSEADFRAYCQTSPRSLRAFEKSQYPEDWRDLMRLFLVRRTRHFIITNYAQYDPAAKRYFVTANGNRFYFPTRKPITLKFPLSDEYPNDQYARLYKEDIVSVIENLSLARYGLANYLVGDASQLADSEQKKVLDNLNRGGIRLIGFCRTNLFKRLESSGYSFLLSVKRHILRNMVTLYALENKLPVPIGTQEAQMLDPAICDTDEETAEAEEQGVETSGLSKARGLHLDHYGQMAMHIYKRYAVEFPPRFQWLPSRFFKPELKEHLQKDCKNLFQVLQEAGEWDPQLDAKVDALHRLLTENHPKDKVLIFTQFADTATYLVEQLKARGLEHIEVVISTTSDPVGLVRRFSPKSNGGLRPGESELRILVATDVLAEGQNLQDCHIVVNFDLPWAIIRLIQRAGRVDRIGQESDTVLVYSFMPSDGVEHIIHLRERLFFRLLQNQEIIGTDESFFGESVENKLRDLYTEKTGILDDDSEDEDVDLTSIALQVWNSAPNKLKEEVRALPPIVYATRAHQGAVSNPTGVLVYLRFTRNSEKHDLLVRVDENGNIVSQSLAAIFRSAECAPQTQPLERLANHHDLVAKAVKYAVEEIQSLGGQLGTLRSVRRKVFERLKILRERIHQQPNKQNSKDIFQLDTLINTLYRFPLKEAAKDTLSRQMRLGIPDDELLNLAWHLYENELLCQITETEEPAQPQILCSLGLKEV